MYLLCLSNPPNANSTQLSDTREGNDGAGNSSATVPAPSSNSEPSPAADPLNPIRSLGDALKEFRRRLEQIQERSSAESSPLPRAGDNTTEPSNIEYLADDEEDYDMQALGPAGEEEVSKLRDLKIDYSEAPADTEFMDVDDAENAVDPDVIEQNPSSLAIPHQPAPSSRAAGDQDIPSALTKSQVQESRLPSDNLNGQQPSPDAPRQLRSEEDTTEFSNELELRLQHWQSAPDERSFSNAQDLWHQYSSLTSQLSYSLCEQLRLVLEPTLASRLKGDYRTGKRLNMKKIIPYIASEFTKDKIWMRRTRPSKREYQVLIALDDSKSMKESRSVHLAYQTLALVCNALSKLEVGDIAIAKFGQSVDLVHGFDQQAGGGGSFSDVNGAEVMRSFNFAQGKTDVLKLVQRSLDVLSDSRERMSSKTGAELWQLELIISDGICQDQEALRSQLRRATEQRVMIVFIIIDSLHQHTVSSSPTSDVNSNSILSMKQATYKMSSSGRMEVMMERYLDNFPFEYYVVLRDVDALPEVLSGTLRQFFERIVEE
jgi:midasin